MRAARLLGQEALPAQRVYLRGYWFQMLRVDAMADATQVV
jgi:hypothetical protein